jgi:Methyltransferase domain
VLRWPEFSADTGLAKHEAVAWLALNTVRALHGEMRGTGRLSVKPPISVAPGPVAWDWLKGRADLSSSPGRILAVDLVVRVCRVVNAYSQGPIHVLDLGCGSGLDFDLFERHLNRFVGYTRVDIIEHQSWAALRERGAEMIVARAEEFVTRLDRRFEFGLVHSNSALEHMRDDGAVIQALALLATQASHPVAQMHVVPASAALPLYLHHGFRNYSRRDAADLADALGGDHATVIRTVLEGSLPFTPSKTCSWREVQA